MDFLKVAGRRPTINEFLVTPLHMKQMNLFLEHKRPNDIPLKMSDTMFG
jgi:hypothetical protein